MTEKIHLEFVECEQDVLLVMRGYDAKNWGQAATFAAAEVLRGHGLAEWETQSDGVVVTVPTPRGCSVADQIWAQRQLGEVL